MPPDAVIDTEAIATLRALSPDDGDQFVREIVALFIEDTPLRLTALRTSLAEGDTPAFTRAAHTIKGSASNVGALELRTLAESIEQRSRHEGLADMERLLAELENTFRRTCGGLRPLLKS